MRVSAGPYTLEIPPNGVAVLYEGNDTGVAQVPLPGGVGYLEALIQFAGEVIRLRAMADALRRDCGNRVEAALDRLTKFEVANKALREALHEIVRLDHHNQGHESRATKIARDALNVEFEP